ncbi:MAG TPA: hypothetical protein VKT73_15120 [Xanthobacteraceae bacterium]|nr:hypothetical protein [Xanthobacteraceae bacterium]
MALDLPPKLWTPPAIGVLRAAEPWEKQAYAKLAKEGVPREVRRAVVAELRRLQGLRQSIIKPAIDDLSRYVERKGVVIPGIGLLPPAGGLPRAATFITNSSSNTNANNQTFSGINIGPVNPDRYVVVVFYCGFGPAVTFSSATLDYGSGATAMTNIKAQSNNDSMCVILLVAAFSGNTTGTVVLNVSSSQANWRIGIYNLNGLSSATPVATAGSNASNPTSGALTTTPGGCAIACAGARSTNTSSWSGATQDFDGSTTVGFSGAHTNNIGGSSVTITDTIGGTEPCGAFASWF